MHAVVIVVGPVEEALSPFYEQLEVEPWMNEPLHENDKKAFTDWVINQDPTALTKTFKELVDEFLEDWTGSDKWKENAEGVWEVWSTYNPKGYWDWYTEGGRWRDNLTNKSDGKCDTIDKGQFKDFTVAHAFVNKGKWVDENQYPNEKEFKAYIKKEISELNDDEWITSVDYHY